MDAQTADYSSNWNLIYNIVVQDFSLNTNIIPNNQKDNVTKSPVVEPVATQEIHSSPVLSSKRKHTPAQRSQPQEAH